VSWRRLEAEAPELARLARARLEASGVAMLGTIGADGSPRIDPIEPFFVDGELLVGAMARSAKARALRRDPRCVLHSSVCGPNAGEAEAKLYGRAEPSAVEAGWWRDRLAGDADVYRLLIERAVTIEWDLAASRMLVRSWTPGRGETIAERGYP
jgi:Pyridoxamine 5'-phosphate oxidase